VQATTRYSTSSILRGYRKCDQFGSAARAGPGVEADLLYEQSVVGARGEIPGHRESGSGSSVLSAKTSPLLSELYRNSDDKPSNSQGLIDARCGRQNGVIGGRAIRVRCAV